jgi:5-methylcytosine-specific restriction endonuclease McrA
MRERGSKEKIRRFFLANIGKVVDSHQLRDAAGTGVSEWARRVRELRDEEGWPILTNNDRADLKPGQYLLTGIPPTDYPVQFSRKISARVRAQVLERNGMTCVMCGLSPGEIDPETGRKVRLHIGHIIDKSLPGGVDDISNLRALCSTCNQGSKNITAEKPTWIWLKAQIKRAPESDKRNVYNWLREHYGESTKNI